MAIAKIKVLRLAHVHYQHPDFQKALSFLQDFGLKTEQTNENKAYLRGYGIQPYIYVAEASPDGKRHFLGGAWVVDSYSDLEAAATLPGASDIKDLDGPGGGKTVSVKDPNGVPVHFVFGQTLRQEPTEKSLEVTDPVLNSSIEKYRRGGQRRFKEGPCPVQKLGHYGYIIPKARYDGTVDWYTTIMNLKISDSSYDPTTKKDETCFMHIDLGAQYTDHHSFFLTSGVSDNTHIHHSSFEVDRVDDQELGHYFLQKRGWTNCWGVGRHILGSQIFDYWFDASGNIVEHYCDGDLVNEDNPWERFPAGLDGLYVWGPDVPLAFVTGKFEDAGLPLVAPPDVEVAKPAEFSMEPLRA